MNHEGMYRRYFDLSASEVARIANGSPKRDYNLGTGHAIGVCLHADGVVPALQSLLDKENIHGQS